MQSTVCSFQRQTGKWEPILIDLFVCFLSTLNEQLPVGGNLLRDERNGRKDEPAGRRIIMTTIAGDTCTRAMKTGSFSASPASCSLCWHRRTRCSCADVHVAHEILFPSGNILPATKAVFLPIVHYLFHFSSLPTRPLFHFSVVVSASLHQFSQNPNRPSDHKSLKTKQRKNRKEKKRASKKVHTFMCPSR